VTCEADPPRYVIRLIRQAHCARGATRCPRCREAEALPPRPCLLDTQPPRPEQARPTIEVAPGHFRAYDVVQVFATVDAAAAHAREHGLDLHCEEGGESTRGAGRDEDSP
jgi:hypothetical protein